jgi:hypothetical protein
LGRVQSRCNRLGTPISGVKFREKTQRPSGQTGTSSCGHSSGYQHAGLHSDVCADTFVGAAEPHLPDASRTPSPLRPELLQPNSPGIGLIPDDAGSQVPPLVLESERFRGASVSDERRPPGRCVGRL